MNNTTKKDIFGRLYNFFERCITSPENPFSMDNPDAIIANGRHLYALFIPTYSEKDSFDHLLRRLHLSQLSYAHRFITILLLEPEDRIPEKGLRVMDESFCHISRDIVDVINFINGGERVNRRWEVINEFQQEHFLRYQLYSDLSQKYKKENNTVFAMDDIRGLPAFSFGSWYDDAKEIRIKGVFDTQNGLVGYRKKGKVPNFISSFQKIMTASFMHEFIYDNGYIYPNRDFGEDKINVISTDWNIFHEGIYPNVYNNMLAFAGLVPVSLSTQIEIDNLYRTFQMLKEDVNR